MKSHEDIKKLEEEASRLAEEFPTLTSALLWVITMIDDHHYKLDLLRDALVRLSTPDSDEAPSRPTSGDIFGALETVREHLAEKERDLRGTKMAAEEAINKIPSPTTGRDDDPTVH